MAFLDTNILGSYYCAETLSAAVTRNLSTLKSAIISPWVELEFASVLALKVRSGFLSPKLAREAWDRFQADIMAHRYVLVQTTPQDHADSRQWLLSFKTPLRTLDAFHLASAANNGHELWTTDKLLAKAAHGLGVPHRLITL